MTFQRLLVVSPVRNEAAHLPAVIEAMAAQTRAPDLWLLVDDGSVDDTAALARAAAGRLPFMEVVEMPVAASEADNEDRLVAAAEARAFNRALGQVDLAGFTHLAKLDGDIQPPPDYFERILAEFELRPALGVGGAVFAEQRRGRWARVEIPPEHVPGAVKVWSRSCFEAVGGVREHLGWDTIDETTARMRGFETGTVPGLVVRHLRPWGTVSGKLRGRVRYGTCAYAARYPLPWVMLRSLKMALLPPVGVSGLAFLWGYARAMARRAPREEHASYRRFVRKELADRIRRKFSFRTGVRQGEVSGGGHVTYPRSG